MSQLDSLLPQIISELRAIDVRFALVGGLAVTVRCEPRFTRDIDLAISVKNDEEAEAIVGYLIRSNYRLIQELDQNVANRLATARLAPPHERGHPDDDEVAPVIDLLFASCGIEPEIVAEATEIQVSPGLSIPAAKVEHLIAMKLLAHDDRHRIQDKADLQSLLDIATPREVDAVRELLILIMTRGYHRDRDLPGLLDAILKEFS